ncbi:MAG: GNAT family N-acetyltransferase [Polyangiaceae bacterium]
MPHALDNPLWASLTTLHAPLALGAGDQLRYPAAVAPFVAVRDAATPFDRATLTPGETVFFVGPRPSGLPLQDLGEILQMVSDTVAPVPDGPPIVSLDEPPRRADVLGLAALVYPHYFRDRTPELGRYLGIYVGDTLAAMVGERMGMPGYREISAVCTHPDFVGRGLARRLLTHLACDLHARGVTPFLHVSPTNTRAVELYRHNGFVARRGMPFAALQA